MSGRDYRHPWAASVKWPAPPPPVVPVLMDGGGLLCLLVHPADVDTMRRAGYEVKR